MTSKQITPAAQQQLAEQPKQQMTMSERFTARVLHEFGSNVGIMQVSDYERNLIQGYFIAIERGLATAEDARARKNLSNKNHEYDNPTPVIWQNVNLTDLAQDVMYYARMGLDMRQSNHLSPIPYKNNKTGKYDVNLMPGYSGIQYIAEKYALTKPLAVTIELVYSTDKFKPIKKSRGNIVEGYEFEITNAFSRGDIIGGFGYIEYQDAENNKLILMSRDDFDKRKPKYAAAEFWGGKTKAWDNGKKVEVETDGWYAEMCYKTLVRAVYHPRNMPIDPRKIDDSYQFMKMREVRAAELEAQEQIGQHANTIIIDTTPEPVEAPIQRLNDGVEELQGLTPQYAAEDTPAPKRATVNASTTAGPNF